MKSSVCFELLLLLTLLTSPSQAGEFNPVLNIGDTAPAWKDLPNIDGKTRSLSDFRDKQVLVVVFTCNSCPYAEDYEDRILAFAKQYCGAESKVGLVAINVNKVPADLPPAMKAKAETKKFTFPYLFDESQQIAKDFGAGYTPEFFVLNSKRQVAYMGALDDNSNAEQVKQRYVIDAVEALLAGKEPAKKESPPVGCRIRIETRKRGNK